MVTTGGSPTAAAADNCSPPLCGRVANATNNQIRIARLGSGKPSLCPPITTGTLRCDWTTLSPDKTSPSGYDVDGFTFPGTGFWFKGFHYSKGTYVRVFDFQVIFCVKVPPLQPTCT
ncbi:hypothetical protein [Amycolatopsis sp. YIM 10]|uniref:hypothetical protein n=1 Tax=Amycolatopsis sp. YIM 10 TaxID=2653857 RepID=UPI00129015DA|nr:hypothetical protein [Amycolatopsis sp. YIM 10]